MARLDDFDDFFGDDDDTPVVDTRADGRLYRVPLSRLAPNLVNPRSDFGTEDELIDFGKSLARRQNQPCPVVSRSSYLKLWPDHADQIGDVDYVLVSGERRYRAATAVGLPALDCVVNNDFAQDRKTFMEAVVSENVDRQNFDPVEEAYAVQALVREFGSNRAVAQHFERVDGWVTQRLLLTYLAPQVQDLVRAKEMPLEAARKLGKLARDNEWTQQQQLEWWQEEQERRLAAAQARAAAKQAAKSAAGRSAPAAPAPAVSSVPAAPAASAPPAQPPAQRAAAPDQSAESFTAVKPAPATPSTPARSGPEQVRQRAAVPQPTAPSPAPDPVPAGPTAETPRRFPYEDGMSAAQHLILKMPTDQLVIALRMLLEHAEQEGLAVPGRSS